MTDNADFVALSRVLAQACVDCDYQPPAVKARAQALLPEFDVRAATWGVTDEAIARFCATKRAKAPTLNGWMPR